MVLISLAQLMSPFGHRGWDSWLRIFCSSAVQSELNLVSWYPIAWFLPSGLPLLSLSLFLSHLTIYKTKSINAGRISNLQLRNPFHFQHSPVFVTRTIFYSFLYCLLAWLSFSWSCLTPLVHWGVWIIFKNICWICLLLVLGIFLKNLLWINLPLNLKSESPVRLTNWLSMVSLSGFRCWVYPQWLVCSNICPQVKRSRMVLKNSFLYTLSWYMDGDFSFFV